jgi:nucleoside-diphosphate-sugar epimerase
MVAGVEIVRKNILITGATGFLGQVVLNKLLYNSEYYFYIIMRPNSNTKIITSNRHRMSQFEAVSIEDPRELPQKLSKKRIDIFLHLATNYGRNSESIAQILEANLILPLSLLKLAISNDSCHFINIDSFYNKPGNFQDRLFDYSQSKAALIPWLKKEVNQIRVSNLILEHMYGPDDKQHKIIPKLIASAKLNYQDGLKLSPGKQLRDFVFVEDVASAIEIIIENEPEVNLGYQDIEVGTGEARTLIYLSKVINKILGINVPAPFSLSAYPDDEIMSSYADTHILKSLGWGPSHSLESGLRKTIGDL